MQIFWGIAREYKHFQDSGGFFTDAKIGRHVLGEVGILSLLEGDNQKQHRADMMGKCVIWPELLFSKAVSPLEATPFGTP